MFALSNPTSGMHLALCNNAFEIKEFVVQKRPYLKRVTIVWSITTLNARLDTNADKEVIRLSDGDREVTVLRSCTSQPEGEVGIMKTDNTLILPISEQYAKYFYKGVFWVEPGLEAKVQCTLELELLEDRALVQRLVEEVNATLTKLMDLFLQPA